MSTPTINITTSGNTEDLKLNLIINGQTIPIEVCNNNTKTPELTGDDVKLNGEHKEYYDAEKTKLKSICTYNRGEIDGDYKEYHENGKLYIRAYFKNGNLQGEKTTYYENGNIKCLELYDNVYDNSFQHGEARSYDTEGMKKFVTTFDRGQRRKDEFFDKKGNTVATFIHDEYQSGVNIKALVDHFIAE